MAESYVTVHQKGMPPMQVPKANKANVEADLIKRGIKGFWIEDNEEKERVKIQLAKMKQEFAGSQTVQITSHADNSGVNDQPGEKSGDQPGNNEGLPISGTTSNQRPGRTGGSTKRKAADGGARKK